MPAQPPTTAPPTWRIIALLMLVAAAGHFNREGISVVGAERLIGEDGLSADQMGFVYSAFLACYTLAMLPGGWLIDRFGPRAALAVFCLGSATFVALSGGVGFAAKGPAAVWLGLLVVRSLMGVSNAPLHPAAARMVFEHVAPPSKSLANGLVTFAACVGIASTYYALGGLIDRCDWPLALLLCSLATLGVAAAWLIGTRSLAAGGTAASAPRLNDVLRLLRRPSVVCLTLSYAALGYFQYVFFYWIQYYFETVQHQGVEVGRRYSTAITLAMGVGMVCGGWLTDWAARRVPRLGARLVPAAGLFTASLVFEAGLFSSDVRWTLAAFAAAAALVGACEAAFWTISVSLGGRFGGTAAAIMNTGGNAGGTLSPYVTPLLSAFFAQHFGEAWGWRLGLTVAGAISIVGALLWFGVSDRKSEPA